MIKMANRINDAAAKIGSKSNDDVCVMMVMMVMMVV